MEAITAKSGPNPSGNTIRRSDQGEKWPKPERERDPRGRGPIGGIGPVGALSNYLYRYMYIYILAWTCRFTATELVDISLGDRT